MYSNKTEKIVMICFPIICLIILLLLPQWIQLVHELFYYVVVAIFFVPVFIYVLITYKKREENFYKKWEKIRSGRKLNYIIKEGAKFFLIQIFANFFGRYVGDGYSPVYILSKISFGTAIFLVIFILLISLLIGVSSWSGNERRFEKICRIQRFREKPSFFDE